MFFAKMNVIGRTVGVDLLPLAGRQPGLARMVREAGDCTTFGGSRVEATWSLCSGFSHGRSWSAASTLQRRDLPEIAPGVWDVEMRAPVGAVANIAQSTQGAGRRPAATCPAPEILSGLGPTGRERHRIAGRGHLLLVRVQFYGRAAKWQEGPLWLADTCQALVVGDDPRAIACSPLQMLGQSTTRNVHYGL